MIQFAIICLIVILIAIQHLLNWGWRKLNDKGVMFILTLYAAYITWACIVHIVLWLYPLIK